MMARQLRDAARTTGDTTPGGDCLATMIRRWEHGAGITERYRLHYCRAFRIPPDDFATAPLPGPPAS